ncbi:thioesterase family protein [Alkalihalophilus lindianensis]|uniref:Thioesterase family protein n=1 Tax=Alkalihalophilus lindianensis TaxID=1630542 RepID=A0ABU3XDZ8_9BACI|nr:thioesterase family protein [Alkalihalophilus lindianensis]MDV2686108.1 thioesterase family protein [Alkalihalophilus lindianensis]
MYQTTIVPRVSETDGAGHINNTTVPVWLEAGRHELFKLFTPDLSFEHWKMIIVKTTLEYVSQIYYGRDVEVKTWVKRIGNKSLELYEEIHQDGEVCAKNEAVYVNFNLETQQSEEIPDEIKEELKQHFYEK